MTTPTWNDLIGCLDLKQTSAASAPRREGYEGPALRVPYHRLYGGQLLAQTLRAARLACPGKAPKSLHTVFVAEGRTSEPVRYSTEVIREGRTFATVRVEAAQEHGTLTVSTASLHAWEENTPGTPGHQEPPSASAAAQPPGPGQELTLPLLPFEIRAAHPLDTEEAATPRWELWMRTPEADAAAELLAYASDLTVIGTALRALPGQTQAGAGTEFTSAVTSHTLWFHRPPRTGDWLRLRQHSPVTTHGRAFGQGEVHTSDGSLTASYAQEALLRFRRP